MNRYIVTYVQHLTQPVDAISTEAAGRFARNHAAHHGLKVLSVEREDLPPQNPPPRTVAPKAAA